MVEMLTRLGVTWPQIERPLTRDELRRNRRLVFATTLSLPALAIASVGMAALAHTHLQGPLSNVCEWAGVLCFCIFACLLLGVVLSEVWEGTSDATISGEQCLDMQRWAERIPPVKAYIASVNVQVRPIYVSDWQFLGQQVRAFNFDARREAAQRACRTLHMVGEQ